MRNIRISEGLCYDDVLLVPRYSEVNSRSNVDVSVTLKNKKGKEFKYNHPIIPANMKSIVGEKMCELICDTNGLIFMHRFDSIDNQINLFKQMIDYGKTPFSTMKEGDRVQEHVGFSIGVKEVDYQNLPKIIEAGAEIICIDIAHGDSLLCVKMCEYIAKNHPEVLLVAGNVATGEGAARLVDVGVDVIKCGIGGGSSCSTRVEAAAGVPQLTALLDVVDRLDWNSNNVSIIADGGIRFAGDAVKALCLADMVMVGGMFAGCDEAPGEMINIDGIQYKEYRGSSTHKQNRIEGVVHLAPYKGSASNILQKITEGIQSGCSYQGVDNLKDLKEEPFFVKISQAGLIESHPHTFNKK